MKTHTCYLLTALLFLILHDSRAQGTAFTYQGRLNEGTNPANGAYDLTFSLFNTSSGGATLGTSNVFNDLLITNGLFTVTLDYGAQFDGNARWLQIAVRPGASTGAYTSIFPRQMITSAPYAITASNVSGTVSAAQLSGTISSANVSGTYGNAVTFNNAGNSFGGDGAGLTGLNASELASGLVPDARLAGNVARTNRVWLLGGNSGTTPGTYFLGTTDPQALELRVNGGRALRLEPTTNSSMVNVIGGSSGNYVDPGVVGATIAGGGTLNYFGNQHTNRVGGNFGVIGGGWDNLIGSGAGFAVIAGGSENLINVPSSVIGGGDRNVIRADSYSSTIAGGFRNAIETNSSTATIGGGAANTIQAYDATIAGGADNLIQTGASSAAIAGGNSNTNGGNAAFIGGGFQNVANANQAVIGGGNGNAIRRDAFCSTIAGGYLNTIETNSSLATIGGGSVNTIQANADNATIAGGGFNTIQTHANLAIIGGGNLNSIEANADRSVIGGGTRNTNGGAGAFIGGGAQNVARGNWAVIGGGFQNVATNYATTVSGGANNVAVGLNAAIGGGAVNTASGDYSFVGAGFQNQATTNFATVPGGYGNRANGRYSLAAGDQGIADHEGAFVWADSTGGSFASTAMNQFSVRANGGVRLVTGGAGMTLDGQPVLSGTISSNQLAAGAVVAGKIADAAVGTAQIIDGTIRSGDLNLLSFATTFWKADGNSGTTAGANFIGTTDSQPLEFKVNSQRALRLEPNTNGAPNVIGGSPNNFAAPGVLGATIGGGGAVNYFGLSHTNKVTGTFGTVSGGRANISDDYATVSGGGENAASGSASTVGGGIQNTCSGFYATVGGGSQNTCSGGYAIVGGGGENDIGAQSIYSTIAGGYRNDVGTNSWYNAIGGGRSNSIAANISYATVAGGFKNIASGLCATVPGGQENTAAAFGCFAAGFRAKSDDQGSFVWADSSTFDFHSTVNNGFFARSVGGVKFVTGIDGAGNETAGVRVVAGASAWSTISDRHAKKNIEPVDCRSVLDKLAQMPVSRWHYKWEKDGDVPNLGPMAQDFKAAFYPGRDDKSISTLEFDGVELAAIQGLNERMKEKDARIAALEKSVEELKELVAKLAEKR